MLGIRGIFFDQHRVVCNGRVIIFQISVRPGAAIIILRIVWFLLGRLCKICDGLVPLSESNFSKPTEFIGVAIVRLEFNRLVEVWQRRFKLALHHLRIPRSRYATSSLGATSIAFEKSAM